MPTVHTESAHWSAIRRVSPGGASVVRSRSLGTRPRNTSRTGPPTRASSYPCRANRRPRSSAIGETRRNRAAAAFRWSSLSAFTGVTKAGEVEFGTAIEGIGGAGAGKAEDPWRTTTVGGRPPGKPARKKDGSTCDNSRRGVRNPRARRLSSGNGNNIPGVPCQPAAPGTRARVTVALALVAAFLAAASACMLTSVPAAGAAESASTASSSSGASVVIDSVSPQVAKPNSTVTVSGTVTNASHSSLPGVSVVLRSSASALASRSDLASYASGSLNADTPVGTPAKVSNALAPGVTARWKLSLSVHSIGISQFGVYPLAVQAVDASGATVGIERTYLPYWPGARAAGASKPLQIAWIWPLINPPQQGICSALTSNSLASSLASGGRLNTLLSVGTQYASKAGLTWAVDPGLLSSVSTMTHSYRVGASTACDGGTAHAASTAASQWLTGVRSAASHGQLFTTPYDDVDVAALTHQGLDSDLRTAYAQGRSTAGTVLGTSGQSSSIAWPADGLADSSVLGNLAVNGISTAVLASSEMPATGSVFTPDDAVTSTPTPAGTTMKVLLADSTLTGVLGSATASSATTSPAGSAFATSQRFLAETAMIEAEDPQAARSVVVAPPRDWDPSATTATDLLTDTTLTPWLSPDTLSSLASSATSSSGAQRQAPPDNQVSSSELTAAYLKQVGNLDTSLRSYQSILAQP